MTAPPFSKDDLRAEAIEVFLTLKSAASFAFQVNGQHEDGFSCLYQPIFSDDERNDADKSQIIEYLIAAYDYCFDPDALFSIGAMRSWLAAFCLLASSLERMDQFNFPLQSTGHSFSAQTSLCIRTYRTMEARMKIDEPTEMQEDLSVEEIALLANMTEGAVRNAMSENAKDRLRHHRNEQGQISIHPIDAADWLSRRRGFVTKKGENRDIYEARRRLDTATTLAEFLAALNALRQRWHKESKMVGTYELCYLGVPIETEERLFAGQSDVAFDDAKRIFENFGLSMDDTARYWHLVAQAHASSGR
ncbi:hypothetical protein [Azospirillum sp.]|uniref:hypothetical protein n=1 Tax=Azospirillum sp. TaxID=34012 RepID=UPI002D43C529|nr:hypothetical protein [Azospirillum sp.]HYF87910.1 hypothetical protein [Azospirillum sp.]